MEKKKVLVLCIHNSARSQMAEEFIRKYAGELFDVQSAGLEPGKLNPNVIKVMQEIGIDISEKKTQSVFELFKAGEQFNYVITVCDADNSERCPIFPGMIKLHWPFEDPSSLNDANEEGKLAKIRVIRDLIETKVKEWIKEFKN